MPHTATAHGAIGRRAGVQPYAPGHRADRHRPPRWPVLALSGLLALVPLGLHRLGGGTATAGPVPPVPRCPKVDAPATPPGRNAEPRPAEAPGAHEPSSGTVSRPANIPARVNPAECLPPAIRDEVLVPDQLPPASPRPGRGLRPGGPTPSGRPDRPAIAGTR